MGIPDIFTVEEWALISGAPHIVGTAVMMASFSGLGGTAKEAFSLASSLAKGRAASDPLLMQLTEPEQVTAAQDQLRAKVKTLNPINLKSELSAMAVDNSKQAVEILAKKVPDEMGPYKEWLMAIAFGVANASKEGDVLGFGGKRISDGERAILDSLSGALGTPVPVV